MRHLTGAIGGKSSSGPLAHGTDRWGMPETWLAGCSMRGSGGGLMPPPLQFQRLPTAAYIGDGLAHPLELSHQLLLAHGPFDKVLLVAAGLSRL